MDHLGFEEADHRLSERIVVRVPNRSPGRLDTGLGLPFRVADGEVLRAAVGVADQTRTAARPSLMDGLFKASSTKPAVAVRLTRHPTMRRA